MVNRLHRALLRTWRHVPFPFRRWIVRIVAPSFTVGTACVIERGDGTILLVRLSYRDGWGLPGGLVGRREDIAQCARREVAEEVGLEVELVGAPAVVVDSHPQRVDVVYRARTAAEVDPDDARATSPEIVEARWHPAGDLPVLLHETVAALMALAASVLGDGEDRGDRSSIGGVPAVDRTDDGDGHGDVRHGVAAPAGDGDSRAVLRLAASQAALQRSDV